MYKMIALLLKFEPARKDLYLLQKKFPKRQESTQSSKSTRKTCSAKNKSYQAALLLTVKELAFS